MFDSLLATKFSIPPYYSNLIHRPRLITALDQATRQNCRLVLLAAPAGFGKTTLVIEWLRESQRSAAWLSLDQEDNDLFRFWRYIIAALQTIDRSIGRVAQTILENTESNSIEASLTALINDLITLPAPVILVLDEYEKIETKAIHASLNFFLDHLPKQLTLFLLTRVDPPLSLARRRSRAQLAETRSDDLRFTRDETAAFLAQVAGFKLSLEDITQLTHRTEGWAAGIQLAAHSLHLQSDPHAFIKAFAGDDHYIVDYLLEEVLQHQSESIKTFLLQTSILERFSPPLCEQVTGQNNSREILDFLEQSNLFIVPLDNRHHWYRYHGLFADLLRWRLRQVASPQQIGQLYRQAAHWHEQEGFTDEAIHLLLSSSNYPEAIRLLEEHALVIFYRSETRLLHQWFKALPESLLREKPLLCAIYANTIALAHPYPPGSLEPAQKWLQQAEASLARQEEHEVTRAFIATFRAFLARYQGETVDDVVEKSLQVIASLPPESQIVKTSSDLHFLKFRGALWNNIGLAYWAAGKIGPAIQASIQARKLSELGGDLFNVFSSVYLQAVLARKLGKLTEAEALCREALQSIPESLHPLEHPTPYAGAIDIVMGQVQLEWNHLEEARRFLARGLSLIQLTSTTTIQTEGYLALARWKHAQGDLDSAWATLQEAETYWPGARALTEIQRVRLWTWHANQCRQAEQRQAALDMPARWASSRQFPDEASAYNPELLALAHAQLALHNSPPCYPQRPRPLPDLQALLRFLDCQIQAASQDHWVEWLVELLILRALAYQAIDGNDQALSTLHQAIDLAEPGGYIRIFVDEGIPVRDLLLKLEGTGGEKATYIRKILKAFPTVPPETHEASPLVSSQPALSPLVEPLSPRELEVIQLVAAGASNADIAQRLYITRNTAKKHVLNIFGKLGVSNRVEAILRAREFGLIP